MDGQSGTEPAPRPVGLRHAVGPEYLSLIHIWELDFVVTYFHSVVEALTKEGVECYYSYPSRKSLIQTLELCIKNVRLEKIRRNISAVIRISPDVARWKNKKNSNQELEMLAIKGSLQMCIRDSFGGFAEYLPFPDIRCIHIAVS